MNEPKRRGLKPGQTNSGSFQKGDGRARGSTPPIEAKFRKDLQELCRAHTLTAVDLLVDTINDDEGPLKLRLLAVEMLLANGHGKPVDRIQLATVNTDLGGSGISVSKLSNDALANLISQAQGIVVPDVIEAECVEIVVEDDK